MNGIKKNSRITTLTALFDAAALALSLLAAYRIRFSTGVIPVQGMAPDIGRYLHLLLVVVPVHLAFFRAAGLYRSSRQIRRIEEIFVVIKAVTYAVILLTAASFFYRDFSYSRVYLLILWFFSILFVSFTRYALIEWEYHRKVHKKELTRVLVVGVNRNARSFIRWARSNPHYGHEIIGILSREPGLVGKHLEGVAILGAADQTESFMSHLKPDQLVVLESSFGREAIMDLVVACEDRLMDFRVAADFYGLMSRSIAVDNISTVPLLGFKPLPLDDSWNRAIKRIFDIAASLTLLVLSAPFWMLAIGLIKWDDNGPFFYMQERVGRDGRVFKLLKFRTMKVDAEKETGPVWARSNDNRRTRVGHFLRRWNLDELPQILNVLRGEMSLVGPRPERPHFVRQFRENIPRYMARHRIKSGITGWAQVHGLRGNTSIRERIKYDLYYMENWSLFLDLEILFMTFFAYKNAY